MPVPNCQSYDPAFAYELAVIIEDGIKRMYHDREDIFYYLTVMNEMYSHPPMPDGARDGILKGMYVCKPTGLPAAKKRAQIFGSGTILTEALKAQQILEEKYGVGADVWSVTSYVNLYRDGHACERWNRLHPRRRAPGSVCHRGDQERPWRLRRRLRLLEGPAGFDRPMAAQAAARAWHRWVRTQRLARGAAQLLRGRFAFHRPGHAARVDAGRADRRQGGASRRSPTSASRPRNQIQRLRNGKPKRQTDQGQTEPARRSSNEHVSDGGQTANSEKRLANSE